MKASSSPPLLATVLRGGLPESRHHGHIVIADTAGKVAWRTAGLTEEPVFYRSAMKPLQALPLLESGAADRFGLGPQEIALVCASHSGEPKHVKVAEGMLARKGARLMPACLKCGTHVPYSAEVAAKLARQGKKPPVLCHNCSGKHSGMLLACRHLDWPVETYLLPSHPLQKRIKTIVAEFADLEVGEVMTGRDGCNLPAHAVSLRRMAMSYARLASPGYWEQRGNPMRASAVGRITAAMSRHPFYVSGTGRSDLGLMNAANGQVFSKIGAEAVWCVGFPAAGLGLALKVMDGANRAEVAILAEALRQTGLLPEAAIKRFEVSLPRPITSTDGTVAGGYRAEFKLAT